MPDGTGTNPNEAGAPGEAAWHEADLEQAIKVAEKSGLHSYRVEIAPDGTISIVIGDRT